MKWRCSGPLMSCLWSCLIKWIYYFRDKLINKEFLKLYTAENTPDSLIDISRDTSFMRTQSKQTCFFLIENVLFFYLSAYYICSTALYFSKSVPKYCISSYELQNRPLSSQHKYAPVWLKSTFVCLHVNSQCAAACLLFSLALTMTVLSVLLADQTYSRRWLC